MKRYTLENGLRVLLEPVEGTETLTALMLVRVGSRYEDPAINGASHFIEHMMFKGTRRRPTAQHISRVLDAVGADYNAFTGKNLTGYFIKVDRQHAKLALDMLSDMLFHSRFDVKEMDRERGVIIEEINMYKDNPLMHVDDLLEYTLFAGSKLGWEIAGTHKTMRSMPTDDVLAFYRKYYQPQNMVLSVAGRVDERTKQQIDQLFGSKKNRTDGPEVYQPFTDRNDVPRVAVQNKKTEQIQLAIGFPSFGNDDERNPAVNLLASILGGNMSSRLFVQVRERKGLAYSVHASNERYEDVGVLSIRAGLEKNRLELAVKTILSEVRKIQREGVTARELSEAKTFLAGKTAIRMEDTFKRAEWYAGEAMFMPRVRSPRTYLKALQSVTASQVQEAAKAVFDEKRMCMAAIGPFKNRDAFLHAANLKLKS